MRHYNGYNAAGTSHLWINLYRGRFTLKVERDWRRLWGRPLR